MLKQLRIKVFVGLALNYHNIFILQYLQYLHVAIFSTEQSPGTEETYAEQLNM